MHSYSNGVKVVLYFSMVQMTPLMQKSVNTLVEILQEQADKEGSIEISRYT